MILLILYNKACYSRCSPSSLPHTIIQMSSPTETLSPPPSKPTISEIKDQELTDGKERIIKKYNHVLSTLPKEKDWFTDDLYNYHGFWYRSMHGLSVEGTIAVQETFRPLPTDIFLACNPKSGTTWLKALAFAIMNRFEFKNDSTHPLLSGNPHDYVPFIEFEFIFRPPEDQVGDRRPRLFATHMPYNALPESTVDSGCRIVYICRDPKDAFISRWFFMKKYADQLGLPMMSFEDGFKMFCKGVSPAGPYWDHVLEYYKASLEHSKTVLFLKYEDMKQDTYENVKRLAEFLGYGFSKKEEVEGVVDEIIQLCSFEKLKNLEVNKKGSTLGQVKNNTYFREGTIGDSKNHLTSEMIELIDGITKEKFRGYDLCY